MASTYLTRTPASAGNRQTWTWSGWVKRGSLGDYYVLFVAGSPNTWIRFTNTDKLEVFVQDDFQFDVITNQVFRDTSAWYHIVVAVDTTQASQSDRIKIYVNGDLVDLTITYLVQNYNTGINNTSTHYFGRLNYVSVQYFDGIIAHTHLIDGTQYSASDFGETDATTGIWKPKTAPSVTYGTNGFFLKFENSGAFGTDSSGNGNNFTVNGTMTQTIDTPSNVFATMNSLDQNGGMTFSEGNLSVASTSASWRSTRGTLGVTQGKWYYEVKVTNVGGSLLDMMVGWGDFQIAIPSEFSSSNPALTYTAGSGNKQLNGVNSSYGASYNINYIIGVAFDADNLTVEFFKNGTSQGSISTGWSSGITWTPIISLYGRYNNTKASFNFGNGYFGTTAVASAQNPDDGIGIFEYSVPTGYKALCTKSINAQEYD